MLTLVASFVLFFKWDFPTCNVVKSQGDLMESGEGPRARPLSHSPHFLSGSTLTSKESPLESPFFAPIVSQPSPRKLFFFTPRQLLSGGSWDSSITSSPGDSGQSSWGLRPTPLLSQSGPVTVALRAEAHCPTQLPQQGLSVSLWRILQERRLSTEACQWCRHRLHGSPRDCLSARS